MRLSRNELRYWEPCKIGNIDAAIGKDGLLFAFDPKDVERQLARYPKGRRGTWLFPNGDREIAELAREDMVVVNPQFVYDNWTREEIP